MTFGNQTVFLRKRIDGAVRDRLNQPVSAPSDSEWSGVLMQRRSSSEAVTNTDVAVQMWLCIGAATDAALAATARDELVYEGRPYQIAAAETFVDFSGAPHHVEVTCQYQEV